MLYIAIFCILYFFSFFLFTYNKNLLSQKNHIRPSCMPHHQFASSQCHNIYMTFFICLLRLWDIECGACLRVLEGHEELVRCIRFDNKRIVSGAYDGSVQQNVILPMENDHVTYLFFIHLTL